MSWIEAIFAILVNPLFYKLTLLSATPLIFAALGGTYSEVTGVTNIALEGIMLMGAFTSIVFTLLSGNAWIGVLMAVIIGTGFTWFHAWASIRWSANQIVSATALVIIAQGTTSFLMIPIFGNEGQTDFIGRVPYLDAGWLKGIPFIGEISAL
jgi:simple sugar transport system permease protein